MAEREENRILELFGKSTRRKHPWKRIVTKQHCPFANTKCFKVRKSQPDVSIGTCSVRYGSETKDIVICPNRMLERRQVFTDCFHLLSLHEPGNELHVVPELSIPGGSVDYVLASVQRGRVRDFVAIELQTLDTTGTVWPERQRLLRRFRMSVAKDDVASKKTFGMNWKMTAKTILVQLHHKVETLEHIAKRLVVVVQDHLLRYLRKEFNFGHLKDVRTGDTVHFHSYRLAEQADEFRLELDSRISTDAAGIAACLGLQAESKVELETILAEIERKISKHTLLTMDDGPVLRSVEMPTE